LRHPVQAHDHLIKIPLKLNRFLPKAQSATQKNPTRLEKMRVYNYI